MNETKPKYINFTDFRRSELTGKLFVVTEYYDSEEGYVEHSTLLTFNRDNLGHNRAALADFEFTLRCKKKMTENQIKALESTLKEFSELELKLRGESNDSE